MDDQLVLQYDHVYFNILNQDSIYIRDSSFLDYLH